MVEFDMAHRLVLGIDNPCHENTEKKIVHKIPIQNTTKEHHHGTDNKRAAPEPKSKAKDKSYKQ